MVGGVPDEPVRRLQTVEPAPVEFVTQRDQLRRSRPTRRRHHDPFFVYSDAFQYFDPRIQVRPPCFRTSCTLIRYPFATVVLILPSGSNRAFNPAAVVTTRHSPTFGPFGAAFKSRVYSDAYQYFAP